MRPPSPPRFNADIANQENTEPNMPAMMMCTQLAGRAIIRVVTRCNDAQENNNLAHVDVDLGSYVRGTTIYCGMVGSARLRVDIQTCSFSQPDG
ncbi:unnamed protein product [Bemisia tabaci]|uniref:Uncharacterized protein n=1 Tax=Bemisia tabaci TaxID=7038 RepID=A0A9P0A2A8_BEMTA|nr:unnamed protein product [Bemisia tabaci]